MEEAEIEIEGRVPSKDEKNWATFAHLAALAGFVVPFGNLLGPLIIWLLKRDESKFVEQEAKESLNFQISVSLYFIACIVLVFLLIGIPLMLILGIFNIVMVIMATIKANGGEHVQYPLNLRLIK